ncbi:FecR family protein [Algoriphagus sp. A40]|uniref:FecR family protein n=1 Tax=Algoriphagus sp. A40 TaxID=1945863 RepID=UPI00098541C2|nr:FecR domain-containing protein [Algoriphagus sp. A40]OOG72987.1 anti-sigma factor [Algoriphagus sp. A40]
MKWEEEYIEDLVGKFIVGEASESEVRDLREWCALSPENQKYLDDSLFIFEKAQLPDDQNFDTDVAWDKVKAQITAKKTVQRTLIPLWKVAAGLILVAAVSYLFYWNLAPGDEFVYLSENQVMTQTLPDQTEISLNKASEVKVEYNVRKKRGTIQLKGEATISIGKEKDIQWTVEAENLLIRDIGTVFHVKAYPDGQQIEVSVLEGAVQFYSQTEEGIMLEVGEKGIYDKASGSYSKTVADTNVVAFKTRSFQFNEENLQIVVDRISEVYDRKITLAGGIGTCKITVEFTEEELDTIIGILSETMGLEVSENGDEIILSGEGCS